MATVNQSKYFTEKELVCKCGCGKALMDSDFMSMLDSLRWRYNHPIVLSSAYRCPEYNNKISGTGLNGPHTTGKAVDVKVSGESAHRLLVLAAQMQFPGIGVSQKGEHKSRFIHLDNIREGTRPWVWSYP